MEPGFSTLGWRELAAIVLALAIVVDWSVTRYHARRPALADPGGDIDEGEQR